MNPLKEVTVPIYELNEDGSVKPNPLFHRPWDKLHSRCIEYPFAAAQIGDAQRILDVGTAKADPAWISWLEALPIDVHATDYDLPDKPFQSVIFHQADVRELPIPDNTFDEIIAVSVIEHIGLENPQVTAKDLPPYSVDGDLEAVRGLTRVLKKGGKLIMTFPFGPQSGFIGKSARIYNISSIRRFEQFVKPIMLYYYEYQYSQYEDLFCEYTHKQSRGQLLRSLFFNKGEKSRKRKKVSRLPNHVGIVTWRKIPMERSQATHYRHIDGVLCGVWKKR